jgi:hypothetical protein
MATLLNLRRAGVAVLVVLAAACSDVGMPTAIGPNTKEAQAVGPNTGSVGRTTVQAIGPNTVTANGVGTSPRPQP